MTKKSAIIISLLFYFSYSFSQQKDTIYGKVKSVREQLSFLDKNHQNLKLFSNEGDYGHHGFSNSKFTRDRFHSWWYNTPFVHYSNYYKEFNEKGKPTYEIWFYKDGDTVTTYKYKYDKKDNLIQIKDIYEIDDYTSRNFTYNYKNKISSSIYYASYDPNLYSYTAYVYDSIYNLIKIKRFDEDGELSSWKYRYDKKGRKIAEIVHKPYVYIKKGRTTSSKSDSIGLNKVSVKYYYDSNDNLLETEHYDYSSYDNLPSKLSRKIQNIYKNNLLEKVLYITDTINSFTEYSYDNQKRKTSEVVTFVKYTDNNRSSEYFYNKKGNIKKLIYTENNKPVIVDFEYYFDNQNNWIKQIKSVNGKKLFVWTREINYYD
ncbi:hypothetical protein [Psychroserpens mesophilus]|uniref:hypothetical protein n=1 Tax=Psychroserpens mesophilus TaxID=325473 RepID=UPI003D65D229